MQRISIKKGRQGRSLLPWNLQSHEGANQAGKNKQKISHWGMLWSELVRIDPKMQSMRERLGRWS